MLRKITPYVTMPSSSERGGACASAQSSREAKLEERHAQLVRKEVELQERERKLVQHERRLAGKMYSGKGHFGTAWLQ